MLPPLPPLPSLPPAPPPLPPSPPPACSSFYARQADTELEGVGVGSVPGPLENCCTTCAATAGCLGFVEYLNVCYFKGGDLSSHTLAGRSAYVLMSPPLPPSPPPSTPPPQAPPPPCPAGFGTASDGTCQLCAKGAMRPYTSPSPDCQACSSVLRDPHLTTLQPGGSTEADCVCDVDYFFDATRTPPCAYCPAGANCTDAGLSLTTLPLRRGYWRYANTSRVLSACRTPGACLGGHTASGQGPSTLCASGYMGVLCDGAPPAPPAPSAVRERCAERSAARRPLRASYYSPRVVPLSAAPYESPPCRGHVTCARVCRAARVR